MPFQPLADHFRAAITFQNADGNQAVNVLWFRDNAGGDPSTRAGVLTSLIAGWLQSDWDLVANAGWEAVQVEARGWNSTEDGYDIQGLAIPGTLTGNAMPSEVTLAVSLRTGLTGRSRRGRVYHVGIGEDNVDGDFISSGYRANLISAYANLISAATVYDFTWVVASFVENGAPRDPAISTNITQIVIVDDVVDSMRKRKPRV